tara:strand:+ start:2798 stop:4033 length:1236 start_codon:yes stop_codon:yes gene_type:complete
MAIDLPKTEAMAALVFPPPTPTKIETENTVVMITDNGGDDHDDELAIMALFKQSFNNKETYFIILVVGGSKSEDERLISLYKTCEGVIQQENFIITGLSQCSNLPECCSLNKWVLQIGPIPELIQAKDLVRYLKCDFKYILQGVFGTTNSSKGFSSDKGVSDSPYTASRYLSNNAYSSYVLRTKVNGNILIPSVTVDSIKSLPKSVQDNTLEKSFKITMGREPANIPITHQLCGKDGANYNAIRKLVDSLMGPGTFENIEVIEKAYIAAQKFGLTTDEQVDGLARMQSCLYRLFNIPCDEIPLSNDSNFNSENIRTGKFRDSFSKYVTAVSITNTNIELTPVYDLVAVYSLFMLMENSGNFNKIFDTTSYPCEDNKDHKYFNLRSECCNPGLITYILEMYQFSPKTEISES